MYETNDYESQSSVKHSSRKLVALVLSAAIVAGSAGGVVGYLSGSNAARSTPSEPVTNTTLATEEAVFTRTEVAVPLANSGLDLTPAKNGAQLTPSEVYDMNVAATVGVSIEGTATNIYGQATKFAASGSGFIITKDGYVVTNNHVVDGATTITVTLTSGEKYEAELIGTEADNDIALLKIDGNNLPTVSIGDSSSLHVGDMVCAIGNPLGELTNTLTVGYVSALDREINTDGTPINMLQTDAAINSGNSGGPLFDMCGNVIAINTAKYASSSIEGLGFSIPINDAMYIIYDLYEYGYVKSKPYLGVSVRDLDSVTAAYYSLPIGVYVGGVNEGSAAEKAGLQEGDIILKLGSYETKSYSALSAALRHFHSGDTTDITVYRAGEELTMQITFDEKLPEQPAEPEKPADTQSSPTPSTGSGRH